MAPSCTTPNCLCTCIGLCSITAGIPLSVFFFGDANICPTVHPSNRGQVQCKYCAVVKVNLTTTATTTRLVDDASPFVLVKALAISRAKDEFHLAVSNIFEFLELKPWHLCC